MVLHFGELYNQLRIVTFRLSPFEQAAMRGIIKHGVPNMLRRVRESVFYVAPNFLLGYATMHYGDKVHEQLSRKNPADYANDV